MNVHVVSQGDYAAMFPGMVDGAFSTFYVLGALISVHDGLNCVDGQPFKCTNERHVQNGLGGFCQFTKNYAFEMEKSQFDFMISNHLNTCIPGNVGVRLDTFKCAGDTKPFVAPGCYCDISKLPMFVVVLKQWIDFSRQCVILPKHLKRVSLGDRVVQSVEIWNTKPVDWTYFLNFRGSNLAAMHDWQECSFNSLIGPFLNMTDACNMRDVQNRMFMAKRIVDSSMQLIPHARSSSTPFRDDRRPLQQM